MSENKIILPEKSLTQYFYKHLSEVNKESLCPLPEEFILYSSEVLDKYSVSDVFYNMEAGKVNEKVLGINFLEAHHKSKSEKKLIYKDIGDTILIQLGLFPGSVKDKQSMHSYYLNLGRSSYSKMEKLDCSFYDIPNFYNLLATSFEYIIKLLSAMSESHNYDNFQQYLLNSSEEVMNIFGTKVDKKVS